MRELTQMEIESVSGGSWKESAGALALAGAIGSATFGGGAVAWGAVTVTAAIATAPVAVAALLVLAAYAGACLVMN